MRTQRGYRALDKPVPLSEYPESGMHVAYDSAGKGRGCPCSEFWLHNPDPSEYIAHEDYSSTAYMTVRQVAYAKESA